MTGTENCDDPSMTPSQQLLCKDDKTFHQTIVGGAIIGTVAGAATGALACAMNGKNVALCAGVGAGVGLFAGGVAGYIVAKQQAAAKSNIRAIDAVTDDIRAENIALQKEIDAANDVTAKDQADLADMNARIKSGELSAEAAQHQRELIKGDSAHLQTVIDHLQSQEKNFTDAGAQLQQPSRSYTRQINELHDRIAALTAQKTQLDQAIAASG